MSEKIFHYISTYRIAFFSLGKFYVLCITASIPYLCTDFRCAASIDFRVGATQSPVLTRIVDCCSAASNKFASV